MIRIKAFQAINDPASCEKFIEGHRRVLECVGVKEVTSANNNWVSDKNVYVIIVESVEDNKILGGARVQVYDGSEDLPMIEATKDLDSKIIEFVAENKLGGTGELCGLWNSIEVAGMGIGSVFLIRTCVALAAKLELESLYALCSPYTTRMASNYGFLVEKRLGNNGTFYYPKLDLLATIVFQKDLKNLPNSDNHERERIFDLLKNPTQKAIEKNRQYEFEIQYEIDLKPHIHVFKD